MRPASTIVKNAQLVIRREMDRRGIALKVVAIDSGINPATLATYFPQDQNADPAQIPGGAIYALCGVLPSDLLSLLMPDGFHIVRGPAEVDHDAFAAGCNAFLAAKNDAHHPDSPGGREIAPCEDDTLRSKVVQLRPAA